VTRPRRAPRHHSRQAALQVLYALDLARPGEGGKAPACEDAFERVSEHFELEAGARAFAEELVRGVVSAEAEIDALLAQHTVNWRLERMAAVDRNVLRLAGYELLHTDTPVSVVLDEAIELARRFGTDRSPAFVNGVLDAVARATRVELRESRV
jgi:N utilization substance protein B